MSALCISKASPAFSAMPMCVRLWSNVSKAALSFKSITIITASGRPNNPLRAAYRDVFDYRFLFFHGTHFGHLLFYYVIGNPFLDIDDKY